MEREREQELEQEQEQEQELEREQELEQELEREQEQEQEQEQELLTYLKSIVIMSKTDYIWMPHPQHFIGSDSCRFRLGTYVNGYIVSTVGEYIPSYAEGKFEDIGYDRKYETMVFRAKKRKGKEEQCCPYQINVSDEVDFEGYNDAISATEGHYRFLEKYKAMPKKHSKTA